MTRHQLGPSSFHLLETYVSLNAQPPYVVEVEEFLTKIAPTGLGEARGSSIVLVSNSSGDHIAAAVHRHHPRFEAEHIQAFVMRPSYRGRGLATTAFTEVRDSLAEFAGSPDFVTWTVRGGNVPILKLSAKVGQEFSRNNEFVQFGHP